MHLKRFSGPVLADVMRAVRDELGPDALILHTKSVRPHGLQRFVRRPHIEIFAATDERPAATAGDAPAAHPIAADRVAERLAELRTLLLRVDGARALLPGAAATYARLLAHGLDADLAFALVDGLDESADVDAAVEARLTERLHVAGAPVARPDGVIAIVGPTGAGKTLLASKLAVAAHLAHGAARLVSLDTLSLGAPGHLATLSRVAGVPHALAGTRDELARALAAHAGRGVLVVDTPGLAPHEHDRLGALGEMLRAAHPVETHVVLPATTSHAAAGLALAALRRLDPTHVAITKLDEVTRLGGTLSAAIESGLPLSYVTDGRDIPNDIRPASVSTLAGRLRGEPA